mmetsp:Transcript_29208/g.86708  ORF Transcript_29208/g.86708 Transcript_29208/m.86708 type:complete len:582 (-) Transcript_29208:124-1869(-)
MAEIAREPPPPAEATAAEAEAMAAEKPSWTSLAQTISPDSLAGSSKSLPLTACIGASESDDVLSPEDLRCTSDFSLADASASNTSKVGDVSIRLEILRGVRASKALRFPLLWGSSPCDLDPSQQREGWPFVLSEECGSIDKFVSHAWSTPGWQRWLTLLIHCYWRRAAAAGFFAAGLLCVLDAAHVLPTFHVEENEIWLNSFEVAFWCPVPGLVSLVVLLSGPLPKTGALKEPMIFLDLLCINQADKDMKQEGIASLAGFLDKSDELVVLFDPRMMQRMWCVFELGVFMKLDRPIHWCPTFLYSSLLILFLVTTVIAIIKNMQLVFGLVFGFFDISDLSPEMYVFLPILVALIMMAVHFCRESERKKEEAALMLARFDINLAECREDSDREFIMNSIRHYWHGGEGSFNDHVRGSVAARVQLIMRGLDATYPQTLLCTSPLLFMEVQCLVGTYRESLSEGEGSALLVGTLANGLLVWPGILKAGLHLARMARRRCRSACTDAALSCLVGLASFVMGTVVVRAGNLCRYHLLEGSIFLAVCVACSCLLFGLERPCAAAQGARDRKPTDAYPAEETDAPAEAV